jgi:cytochrome c biogenesis protein CcdA
LAHRAEIVAPVTGGRIPLATGFAAALGVLTFAILLGAAIALVSGAVIGSLSVSRDVGLQVFRGAVGVTLMLLGVTQFRPGGLGFARLRPLARVFVSGSEGHQMRSLYLYGLGYQTVGIGCSGPFLASLILLAMAGGGAAVALGAFAVYALTMTGLMVGVTLLVRYTELRAIGPLVRATPSIKRIAALVQLAVGAFLLLSSVFVELFAAALFP